MQAIFNSFSCTFYKDVRKKIYYKPSNSQGASWNSGDCASWLEEWILNPYYWWSQVSCDSRSTLSKEVDSYLHWEPFYFTSFFNVDNSADIILQRILWRLCNLWKFQAFQRTVLFFTQTFSRANCLLKFYKQTEPVIRTRFSLYGSTPELPVQFASFLLANVTLWLLTDNHCINFPSCSLHGTLQGLTKSLDPPPVKCLSNHLILHSYKKLSQIDIDDSILTAQVCSKWKES